MKISIIMSVYNSERYIKEAVESVLGQTFGDFEFIIIDDGSTDSSVEILQGFHDERIVFVRNDTNIGLTKSLNKGLQLASGEYIARLDADDISSPLRLEKQGQYLDSHPEVGLVASAVQYIGPDDQELGVQRIPVLDFAKALLDAEFCWEHSSSMFRAQCIDVVGPYRPEFQYAQDYDLWLRLVERYEVAVLPEALVKKRLHPAAISTRTRLAQRGYVLLAIDLAKQRRSAGSEEPELLRRRAQEIRSGDSAMFSVDEAGRAYLRGACLNYLVDNVPLAKQALRKAVQSDPHLLTDEARVSRLIAFYGLDHATTPETRSGAVRFVERFFANLPAEAESMSRFRSKALAKLHIQNAFDSWTSGQARAVRREILLAVRYDPAWLGNRGVWSMFLKSFIGAPNSG